MYILCTHSEVIGIQFVVEYRNCPGIAFSLLTILLRVYEPLFLLVGRYAPKKINHVHNKDKPWFDDQCRNLLASIKRIIFGGPVIAPGLRLTEKSLSADKRQLLSETMMFL